MAGVAAQAAKHGQREQREMKRALHTKKGTVRLRPAVRAAGHTALHPWETRRWENGEARQDADESFCKGLREVRRFRCTHRCLENFGIW